MTTSASPVPPALGPKPKRLLPLQSGDRLTRAQFMERYAAMPPGVKAERIEGIVYLTGGATAVSAEFHGQPHADLVTWFGTYRANTPGVVAANDSTTVLDSDNDLQPDASLRILPRHGGRTTLDAEGYIQGGPELVAEVTASNVSYDLHDKLNAYRRNGVQEYLVWRTYDGEIDWFVLRDGRYEKLAPDAQGIYRSAVFPGLWLKADALLAGRLAEVLAVLQQGIASDEHVRFGKALEEKAARPPQP
jgi:Uma2 family endonuclease